MTETDPRYARLRAVLDKAYAHAAVGKGKERHASGEAFEHQPIVTFGKQMRGSIVFNVGQAAKKSFEAERLPVERAIDELVGAINYIAGAVIILEDSRAVALSSAPKTEAGRRVRMRLDLEPERDYGGHPGSVWMNYRRNGHEFEVTGPGPNASVALRRVNGAMSATFAPLEVLEDVDPVGVESEATQIRKMGAGHE